MWDNIIQWFENSIERRKLVNSFNENASLAWDKGQVPTLLRSKTTWGNRGNKHNFSKTLSGFRITTTTNGYMNKEKCSMIGLIIMSDQELVRKLIRCGYDTLEVFGDNSEGFETGLHNLLIENK